jgi:hypothetical protein
MVRRMHDHAAAVVNQATKAMLITHPKMRIWQSLVDLATSLELPRQVYASVKFRVIAVSTGMPGPVVVEMTIFFR